MDPLSQAKVPAIAGPLTKLSLVMACIVLGTSMGIADTFYVDIRTGDDSHSGASPAAAWKTLAKVNSHNFVPGDAILLKRGGEWHGQLTVPSSGSPGNPIIYGAYGEGKKPIINALNTYKYAVFCDEKSHLVFTDLVLSKGTRSGFCAFGTASDLNLIRVEAGDNVFGFEFKNTNSVTLQGCDATHNRVYGYLFMRGSSNVRLENSRASYNGSRGVQFDKGVQGKNLITGGEYHHHSEQEADGVAFDATSNIIIENATFHHNSNGVDEGDGIQLYNVAGAVIRYCSFVQNHQGIAMTGQTRGGAVYYNLFRKNRNQQIVFSDASNTAHTFAIYNNVFYLDSGNAVLFAASPPSAMVKVANNIFYLLRGATFAVDLERGLTDQVVSLDHNCYFHEAAGNILRWQGAVYTIEQLQIFQQAEQQDLRSFSEDPLWMDADSGDFSLRAASPCVDRGSNVSLNRDFTGSRLPKGLSVDIGAFEYGGSLAPSPPKAFRIAN
jgi:hypothetical protein